MGRASPTMFLEPNPLWPAATTLLVELPTLLAGSTTMG